jgi:hypothetical protein
MLFQESGSIGDRAASAASGGVTSDDALCTPVPAVREHGLPA